jgi:tripartite ATP-independent transporter DctM subunit
MEWYVTLLILFGLLVLVLLSGMPVAFSFMMINIVGLVIVFGGFHGLGLLTPSASDSVANFNLTPLPMFILMGEFLTRSGLARLTIDAADKWIGKVPGRLSVVAVGGGTFFAALSGSAMASTAMLGSTLMPEMERRGYKPQMSLAPILGAASLDPLIPPSALAILLGVLANVSIAKLLIAGAAPGLVLAGAFMVYFMIRAALQPHLAPAYDAPEASWRERLWVLRHIIPMLGLMFIVLGLIFLGIATPTETAALGALTAGLLAAAYRKLSWEVVRESAKSTVATTAMVLMIFVGSKAYSQMLAATGASTGWINWVVNLPLEPILIIVGMVAIVVLLGLFVDAISIMLLTVPLFMPVVSQLGFDSLWFTLLMLIALELGGITPPFGLQLFVMKATQPHIPTAVIFNSVWPIVIMQLLCIVLFMLVPGLTYLPLQFMR